MTETRQIFASLIDRIERTNNYYLKNEKSRYNLFNKLSVICEVYDWYVVIYYDHFNGYPHAKRFDNNELEKALNWFDWFRDSLRMIESY